MPLSESDVKTRLVALPGWKFDDDEIEKKFTFGDFAEAMAFVNAVARAAESMDHHPDIEISYNKVKLSLSTHSEHGVTEKDLVLAAKIEKLAPAPAAAEAEAGSADDDSAATDGSEEAGAAS